jgi:hypothetical protein
VRIIYGFLENCRPHSLMRDSLLLLRLEMKIQHGSRGKNTHFGVGRQEKFKARGSLEFGSIL